MSTTITTTITGLLNASEDLASIVSDRIYSQIPENDATAPFVFFGRQSDEPSPPTLRCPSTLTKYSIVVDLYTYTIDDLDNGMAMIRSILDGYYGDQIQIAFYQSGKPSPELQEDNSIMYHGEQYFDVWWGRQFSSSFSYSFV